MYINSCFIWQVDNFPFPFLLHFLHFYSSELCDHGDCHYIGVRALIYHGTLILHLFLESYNNVFITRSQVIGEVFPNPTVTPHFIEPLSSALPEAYIVGTRDRSLCASLKICSFTLKKLQSLAAEHHNLP